MSPRKRVQVIDTVNKRYLVMEYTAGGTLEDVLKLRKQLQVRSP